MTEEQLLQYSLRLVATLFGLLMLLVTWLGARVIVKLDAIPEKIAAALAPLYERTNNLSDRLRVVETRCDIHYGRRSEDKEAR